MAEIDGRVSRKIGLNVVFLARCGLILRTCKGNFIQDSDELAMLLNLSFYFSLVRCPLPKGFWISVKDQTLF
jgi:hypothetical protein